MRNMQIGRLLLVFFSHGGHITVNGWGQCLCPPRSLSISSSPPSPLAPPNILYAYFKCHPPCAALYIFFFFFKANPPVTGFQLQLLLVSLLSEKSTSLEASYQNLLQQGGRLKLSGMTCGVDGAGGGGDKCMANLWSIWIRGWGLWRGSTQCDGMANEKSLTQPRPSVLSFR